METIITGILCLAVGAVVGALVYRNNARKFEGLAKVYLKQADDYKKALETDLAKIKEKLEIK